SLAEAIPFDNEYGNDDDFKFDDDVAIPQGAIGFSLLQ
ncbi:hypothetical protein Tco_1443267, partial [Tanacetum coccineum]